MSLRSIALVDSSPTASGQSCDIVLIRATDIELSYAAHLVLRGANITVSKGECVALIGNNGSGKSSLLRVLCGEVEPDSGTVERPTRPGMLTQGSTLPGTTVGEALREALAWHNDLIEEFESASQSGDIIQAGALQDRLDDVGWDLSHQVEAMAGRLGTPTLNTPIENLSGGQRRRVALARALLQTPDLLLLDEPTNHLDSDAIEWLQGFLQGYRGGVLLVTHDRYMLEAVADRIVEIDDGETINYDGSYGDYLIASAERRARLEKAELSRVATLAREAAWAARSPAARTTKQRARLNRLEALQAERPLLRQSSFDLDLATGFKGGAALIELDRVDGGYGDTCLIRGLSAAIQARSCVGILGPNGVGKSTLMKLISRELEPLSGQIYRAPRVKLAVIDQGRSGLNDNDTLFDAAGGGNSHVTVRDHSIHVASFLRRFLFRQDQLDQRVSALSGGERMRLLLAKLLLSGANVILLDEPTNDLDLMTLRVLEDALMSFDGASIVISHDRALLDRVATSVLSFEGDQRVVQYASRLQAQAKRPEPEPEAKAEPREARAKEPRKGLTWKEQRELEALPSRLESLEADRDRVGMQLSDPELYKDHPDEVSTLGQTLQRLEKEIAEAYSRWEDLESRA